ncbi:MAG: hypothetical protein ACOC5D_07665 [Thermoplasmatota archaeon]
MNKYITLVGKEYWETLNSIWAVIKEGEFEAKEVHIISEKENLKRAKVLKRDIKKLLSKYDLDTEVQISLVEDHDGLNLSDTIKEITDDQDNTAIDITGGRKYLVAGSLVNAYSIGYDHVFYLDVKKIEDISKPYPTIPGDEISIIDFMKTNERGAH